MTAVDGMNPLSDYIVPLSEVALYALLNPAVILVAFAMGRKADQAAKLLIAAFAGAAAGVFVIYIASVLGVLDAPRVVRAAGGVFILSLLTGLVYAWIGYRFKGAGKAE